MNYYDVYGEKLSDDIKNRYLELLKMLNNEHIILLFRGDKLRNISKKFLLDFIPHIFSWIKLWSIWREL